MSDPVIDYGLLNQAAADIQDLFPEIGRIKNSVRSEGRATIETVPGQVDENNADLGPGTTYTTIAAVSGSFSYISDDFEYEPAEFRLDFCARDGAAVSLPTVAKPAFTVGRNGVELRALDARGTLRIGEHETPGSARRPARYSRPTRKACKCSAPPTAAWSTPMPRARPCSAA
jgi:hypothetical protein